MQTKHVIYTGALGLIGAAGTALFVPSCDTDCPDEPRAAVAVKIVNPGGQDTIRPGRIEGVTYTFRGGEEGIDRISDEGERRSATCLDDDCSEWIMDASQPGVFDITATVCGEEYTKRVEVYPEGDECYVTAKEVILEVSPKACPDAPPSETPPTDRPAKCDDFERPSVWVSVFKPDGSILNRVLPRRGVWYETRGERHEAICIPKSENECWGWVAGVDTLGRFTVGTDFCDNTFSETVTVTKTEDGCHADTQWVSLVVDTLGCLSDAPEPGEDFDPDITNRPDPPKEDPSDITNKPPHGDPPVDPGPR